MDECPTGDNAIRPVQFERILALKRPEAKQAVEEMELCYDQIDRIRRLKPRVDDGTETDPLVIFDVQQLPAVVAEFSRVFERLQRLHARVPDEAEVMEALALWESYRDELGV